MSMNIQNIFDRICDQQSSEYVMVDVKLRIQLLSLLCLEHFFNNLRFLKRIPSNLNCEIYEYNEKNPKNEECPKQGMIFIRINCSFQQKYAKSDEEAIKCDVA